MSDTADDFPWVVIGHRSSDGVGPLCARSRHSRKRVRCGLPTHDSALSDLNAGRTYCFGSKEAMAEFMKNPKENLAKAQTYYSKKHPG